MCAWSMCLGMDGSCSILFPRGCRSVNISHHRYTSAGGAFHVRLCSLLLADYGITRERDGGGEERKNINMYTANVETYLLYEKFRGSLVWS